MGNFIAGLFLVDHCPEPSTPLIFFLLPLCPALALVLASLCKSPWVLLLTSCDLQPWIPLSCQLWMTASGWEALDVALHVVILLWDWNAGGC